MSIHGKLIYHFFFLQSASPVVKEEEDIPVVKEESLESKEKISSSTKDHPPSPSEHASSICSQTLSTETPLSSPTTPTSDPVRTHFLLSHFTSM